MPKILSAQLTKKQAQLFDYLDKFEQRKHYSPALSNMANHFDVSIPTIHQHVDYLERKGYLVKEKGVKYSIKLIRKMSDLVLNDIVEKTITESISKKKEKTEKNIEQKGNPKYEFFLGDSLKILPQLTRKYNMIYL